VPAETALHPRPDAITRETLRSAQGDRRFAAVILDFDETIIDLEPQHTGAHSALCEELGANYLELPETMRKSSGMRIIDDIRQMRAHFGWRQSEDELFGRRQKHFDELCERAPLALMPGVEETVKALHERGYTLAITSSAVGSSIEKILNRLRLRACFDLIVDGSEVVHGKPDPEAYLLTARKLGVRPEECVVIEDSHVGVLAAKRAGMFCVAVPNPNAQTPQDVSAADVILPRIDAVLILLDARSAPPPAG
jgi:HAD superfamily hydrolase (TIGR01509 family)